MRRATHSRHPWMPPTAPEASRLLRRELEGNSALAIQSQAQVSVYCVERHRLLLTLRGHVVKCHAIHSVRTRRPNGVVLEGHQVQGRLSRLPILIVLPYD